MIKRIIINQPKAARHAEALNFAKEINERYNQLNPKVNQQVFIERFGNVGQIYWISQFESLAEMEAVYASTFSNADFVALYAKGYDLMVEGSLKILILGEI